MPEESMNLGIGPIVILVAYLFVMIGIGWLGKMKSREKSLSDFYLGGSSFGVFVLFLTLFATQYSGNTLLGFAGTSYTQGGRYVVSILFMILAITLISIYAPRLYRLAKKFHYITPADFIYHRFGSHPLRIICTLLFGGCMCILYILLTSEGGLSAAAEVIQQRAPEKLEVPAAPGIRTWVSTILLLGFGVGMYPHAIQRIFAARNLGVLKTSLAGMAFMPFFTTMLAFLLGYLAISRYEALATPDQVTLYMLRDMMAGSTFVYWLVVLVLVALVAAIMSTSDSALLSIQSMVTKDIYKPYINPGATPRHFLWTGKLFGWALMALLVSQAWLSQHFEMSIWQLIKLKLEFMVQISPVFLLGVYWRRLTAGPVLLGVCTGTAITLVLWVGALFGFWGEAMKSPWGISAGVWGLAANYTICIVGGVLSPQAEPVATPQRADA